MSESEKSGRDTARDQSNQEEVKGVRGIVSQTVTIFHCMDDGIY